MNKKAMLAVIVCLCAATAVVAATDQTPGPDPAALWLHITKTDPYKNWQSWPDYQGVQPARSPHKPLNKVFVNAVGLASLKAPVNYGTIEVKETLTQDMELRNITVQYKLQGFNPDGGDWYWAMYDPDGTVKMAGKLDGCIACHENAKANDYVMVHNF